MNLHLNIREDKVKFFLELIEQLEFVEVVALENSTPFSQFSSIDTPSTDIISQGLEGEFKDLQDEINDLMG